MSFAAYRELVGRPQLFQGVLLANGGCYGNQFRLGNRVFQAMIEENRSFQYFRAIIEVPTHGYFYPLSTVHVQVLYVDNLEFRGYKLFDTQTDHVWLEVGDKDRFVFNYKPRPGSGWA